MKQLLKTILPLIGKWGLTKNLFLGILSGVCSFLFIQTVNRFIARLIGGNLTADVISTYIPVLAVVVVLFIWTRRLLYGNVINLSQALFWDLRKQILSSALNANYEQLAKKRTDINTAILNDVNALTQGSWTIIDFFISTILGISCLVYLASISLPLFAITLATVIVGITFHTIRRKHIVANFDQALVLENAFVKNFNAILNGFKEIFLSPEKGKAIYNDNIVPIAQDSRKKNVKAHTGMLTSQLTGQFLFYILISSILLFLSPAFGVRPSDTVSFVFTLLYLLGAISTAMGLLPVLVTAGVAYKHMANLQSSLEEVRVNNPAPVKSMPLHAFHHIRISDLEFTYANAKNPFGIGPISLSIEKGETIFIYGGNGSGKTTFIHCLLGLYFPSAGEIKINNTVVINEMYAEYKAVFSVVFSDFYLFDELFGIENPNLGKWNFYLNLFELADKVLLEGKRFSTVDLSAGQRKRLALILALLEERPVLILDEWAADQDPYFRKKFYTEIIPLLKQERITIVAITHDDKYYHCADKLYRMDDGKLIEENVNMHEATLLY
jgi:putative pyoverdin transport system ATP-binding/permease protein